MSTAQPRRVHQYPNVRQYMTPSPCTIGPRRSLAVARTIMLEREVRHLPVLDGGVIVGVLSERDLFLVESLPGVNPTNVYVDEAMVADPYTVAPETPVADVAETMIDRKIGSAIVVEDGHVTGVFTTIDALRALSDLLARR